MGPTGWALVTAAAMLLIAAMNTWLLHAIEAGRLRRNQFVGIRTATTMRDDTSWQVAPDASIPSVRWSVGLAIATAVVVVALRQPPVSAFGLVVPLIPMVVGGVQGHVAARRHQQGEHG